MRPPSLPVDKEGLLATTWPFFLSATCCSFGTTLKSLAGSALTVDLRLLVRVFRSVGPVAVTVALVVVRVVEMALFNGV